MYVLDLPELKYVIYSGYFGDPIEFDGENLLKLRVWAAVLPSVVAPLPNVSQMKDTSVY